MTQTEEEQANATLIAFCHGAYALGGFAAVAEADRGKVAKDGGAAIAQAFERQDFIALRDVARTLVCMETDPHINMRDSLKFVITAMKHEIRRIVGL